MENSNIVKLNSWNKKKFITELNELDNTKSDFYFDDRLINNIYEFFTNKLNLNSIKLHKFDDLDTILLRKANKIFTRYHKEFLENDIKFVGFSQEEICLIISKELYFLYCNKYKIKFIKNLKSINDEIKKLKVYSDNLFKYFEFDLIYKFYNKTNRYLYFNFPEEKDLDRFVFYFLINTQEDKDEIVRLLKNINFNTKCLEIFSKISVCENGSLYAVGFNYKNEKLVRSTIYCRLNKFSSKTFNNKYLKKHFNLDYNFSENLIVKDWGFDVCSDGKNILKLYFKESNFKSSQRSELFDILNNKTCVACYKFIKNELVDEKYEFSNNIFTVNEIKVLEKFKIYNKESKLFSIYFDKSGNIKNTVNYII